MAPRKLSNFFEGHRRKARLRSWTHLVGAGPEQNSRIKLELSLPILGESYVGLNPEISDPFNVMAKEDSTMGRTPIDIELEKMTVEFFSTADKQASQIPAVSNTGCRIVKFALVPEGEDEKRTITLNCVVYAPATVQLRDWAWELNHKDFGMEAVFSQGSLVLEAEEEEDEDEEEEEEEKELVKG